MAIRHFRKRAAVGSGTDSEESSAGCSASEHESHNAKSIGSAENAKANSSRSESHSDSTESSSSCESSDSSSEDDAITLHKPVLIKRKLKKDSDEEDQTNGTLVRAAHLAKVEETRRFELQVLASETLDQSITKQILALDDTDGLNPEKELSAWEQRHKLRLVRERNKRVQKQMELEEQEMNKATRLELANDFFFKDVESSHSPEAVLAGTKPTSRSNELQANNGKDTALPSRLNKEHTRLGVLNRSSAEDTEYDYLES